MAYKRKFNQKKKTLCTNYKLFSQNLNKIRRKNQLPRRFLLLNMRKIAKEKIVKEVLENNNKMSLLSLNFSLEISVRKGSNAALTITRYMIINQFKIKKV